MSPSERPPPGPFIILLVPFTLSHAAAALPFRRTRLLISAVVVGCFAPDFEYFLRLGPRGGFGHTFPGLFILDLPVAFAVLWLFHRYAKEPLALSLPGAMRGRFQIGPKSLSIDSFSRFALVVFSILVGETTHIVWDWFTHPRYWLYRHWDFLRMTVRFPIIGRQQYCNIFQYVSSVAGVLIILLWCIHWYRSAPLHPKRDPQTNSVRRIVLACGFLAIVTGFFRSASFGIPNGIHGWQRFTTQLVVTAISVFWIEIVIYGFTRNAGSQSRAA